LTDKVSVIIPSLNEQPYLEKTILNVLENGKDVEVIVVLDGWLPSPQIVIPNGQGKVIWIHHEKPKGQRQSVNIGARAASGKYIMKLDAHCAVGKDFDVILARDCKYEWTMVPAMFNLDVLTWKPRNFDDWEAATRRGKLNPYMYIGWKDGHLRSLYYGSRDRKRLWQERKDKSIDETMTCMGPGFFMHKDRFWELGGMDENHGHWGQMGVEVACKAWLSGGKLMTNKNTWFAHFFRGGGVPEGHKSGFPYKLSQGAVERARKYSDDLWLNDKWEGQKKTFQWLVEKFNPPTWEDKMQTRGKTMWPFATEKDRMEMFSKMYNHIHRRKNDILWKGLPIWKFPTDLILYQEAIYENKPDYIVEIGTAKGGSALFFQDMLDLFIKPGGGKVITLDIRDRLETKKDNRITYLLGDSKREETYKKVKEQIPDGKKVMVTIDGNHDRVHVKWDLHWYSKLVTKGQFLVVEDCYVDRGLHGPGIAKEWFLERYSGFKQTDRCLKYLVGITMSGWLLKI